MATIKVGVITEPTGAHLDSYLRSLASCDGVEAVAMVDPTGKTFEKARDVLRKKFRNLQTFGDYREMLQEIRPAMALVTLEAHHAPPPIRAALESGCHVLAEKPSCVRLEQFKELVKLAESKNRFLMLALANRFSVPVEKARELVVSGMLGKLYAVDFYLVSDQTRLTRPAYQQSWSASKAKAGGGHLIWLGIHWLDLVLHITGAKVRQVGGFARNVGGQPVDIEDAAVLTLLFDNGMVATFQSGYYLDKGNQSHIVLWGSDGWLRFDLAEARPFEWHSTRRGAPRGLQTVTYTRESNQYHPLVQGAVNAARGIAAAPITGAECLHALGVIFSLYRAAETGRTQTIG